MNRVIEPVKSLKGEITPPPDKSISHRAVLFSSLAEGTSRIRNFLWAKDPISSLNAMRALGVEIEVSSEGKDITIHGRGLRSLREPEDVIDCGNSGTTIRLLSGILAGNPFLSILTGDESLRNRPMRRIIEPLSQMGSTIWARADNRFPPIAIRGGSLRGIKYHMPIASAQVKSALILASLYSQEPSEIVEPAKSRDHTERMLKSMGVNLKVDGNTIIVEPLRDKLSPIEITIPGDFSSASFFIAASTLVSNSQVLLRNVCLNHTRTGFFDVLKSMGGNLEIVNHYEQAGEPVGDLLVRTATSLKGVTVQGDIIPRLIDEFPILCVVATQAEGKTVIRDAKDLRAKESDRIRAMVTELRKMGVEVEEFEDGVEITGPCKLKGAEIYSYRDHRIAMAFSIAALIAEGETKILESECVDISFPDFFQLLEALKG